MTVIHILTLGLKQRKANHQALNRQRMLAILVRIKKIYLSSCNYYGKAPLQDYLRTNRYTKSIWLSLSLSFSLSKICNVQYVY